MGKLLKAMAALFVFVVTAGVVFMIFGPLPKLSPKASGDDLPAGATNCLHDANLAFLFGEQRGAGIDHQKAAQNKRKETDKDQYQDIALSDIF